MIDSLQPPEVQTAIDISQQYQRLELVELAEPAEPVEPPMDPKFMIACQCGLPDHSRLYPVIAKEARAQQQR